MLRNFIIAMDLDGTLLNNNKKISVEDFNSIKNISKDNKILIASGRNHNDVFYLIYDNKIENYIFPFCICSNGQEIYDLKNKKVIYDYFIHYDIVKKIIYELNLNNIYWYCICNKKVYCQSIKYNCEKYFINKKYELINVSDIGMLQDVQIQKFIISVNDEDILKKIIINLKNKYYVDFMKFNRKKNYEGNKYFENIVMAKGINKYQSIKKLLEKLGLTNSIIAIGDGLNDYELLLNATYSICMENSDNRIKEICDFVTKNNCTSGISYAFNFLENLL